ncbi:MAG: F0F1 ATP synthase subunit delta [Gammaproteobacteria bacterium]|nr:MAG: F0F1 ATP synthase subunit delta [Gammaproteobacteria bacterium]
MSEVTTAARPYARAIYELAREQGSFDKWSEVLAFLAAAVRDEQVQQLLNSPRLTEAQKAEAMVRIAGDLADDQVKRLIEAMAENGRLGLIPEVQGMYEQLRDEAEGVIEAEVLSAQPLSDADQKALAESLKKRLGKEVKLVSKVDESLLGGAVIRAGDIVIDGSIQGRLHKLASVLSR